MLDGRTGWALCRVEEGEGGGIGAEGQKGGTRSHEASEKGLGVRLGVDDVVVSRSYCRAKVESARPDVWLGWKGDGREPGRGRLGPLVQLRPQLSPTSTPVLLPSAPHRHVDTLPLELVTLLIS